MGRIKGITVTLTGKTKTGRDDFGHPIYENKEIQVENVLVVPASTEDITNQLNLTGKKASYTLGIPKGDRNEWKDREVLFFGRKWRTIGIPLEGIESMMPLNWNKKVMVEAYE
jgi:gp43|nr:MAG TPA: Minor capsid protein [Caudoviricetes sp.]